MTDPGKPLGSVHCPNCGYLKMIYEHDKHIIYFDDGNKKSDFIPPVQTQLNLTQEVKMADISGYVSGGGTFLKAEDVETSTTKIFTITGEAKLVTSEKFQTQRLHVPGQIQIGKNTEERTFDMSKTNSRTVSEVLGTDTAKWTGKTLLLETYKTKTSDGKMTLAINVKEVRM